VRRLNHQIGQPQLLAPATGETPDDFVIRGGLVLPVDETASWRPLPEGGIERLSDALKQSSVQTLIYRWAQTFGVDAFSYFDRRGFNRARHARLTCEARTAQGECVAAEIVAQIKLPDKYGTPASSLEFTLDFFARGQQLLDRARTSPGGQWHLTISGLYYTLNLMPETLVDQNVAAALANLAGVDPVTVPMPAIFHFLGGRTMTDLLHGSPLIAIPDAGPSRGALLMADPTLDPSRPDDRRVQVNNWMVQIALDSGLRGMEKALDQLSQEHPEVREAGSPT
jgi:hypothetical protein